MGNLMGNLMATLKDPNYYVGLKVACIKRKPKPTTIEEWQEAAIEEQGDFL
jgi:hypothetical protein